MRVRQIEEELKQSKEYREKRKAMEEVLTQLRVTTAQATRVASRAASALPQQEDYPDEEAEDPISAERMIEILGNESSTIVEQWERNQDPVKNSVHEVERTAGTMNALLDDGKHAWSKERERKLKEEAIALERASANLTAFYKTYKEDTDALYKLLRDNLDERAGLQTIQDVVTLRDDIAGTTTLLDWYRSRDRVKKDLEHAVEQIDKAKAAVLDEKFKDLSDEIGRWWHLLRPEEPTSFDGVHRAGAGIRYVDLKARLSPSADSTEPGAIRDAVAVFSDSQLNCLGLAAFLARVVREEVGFVILDDPVPASDDEHIATFVHYVLRELEQTGVQVVLLMHDQDMWTNIQTLYQHLDLDVFQISLDEPAAGARIAKTSDNVGALLHRASPFIASKKSELRKLASERIRDAAERFCKEVIVREEVKAGKVVNISDYSMNLGQLIPLVEPYLEDPSHSGKLKTIARTLNPGKHDDKIPMTSQLKVCFGDMKRFIKTYLT